MVFIKTDNPAYKYILEARKYKSIPSKAEQIKLFEDYQKTGDIKLKNKLINSNLMWVVKRAYKYITTEHHAADIINQGNLGLFEAFDNFDSTKDMSFTSFCSWYIDLQIKTYLQEESDVYLPHNQLRLINNINKIKKEFKSKNLNTDISLIIKEYNARYNENVDESFYTSVNTMSKKLTSLDDELSEDSDATVLNTVIVKNNIDESDDTDHLNDILNKQLNKYLTEREKVIIEFKFGLNGRDKLQNSQIADRLNLTRERVGQILTNSLIELKKNCNKNILNF